MGALEGLGYLDTGQWGEVEWRKNNLSLGNAARRKRYEFY
jgi:hypothetical protein